MIIDESTYALASKQSVDRSHNDRNEIINNLGAITAAKFIQKKKELFTAILAFVVSIEFKNNFR